MPVLLIRLAGPMQSWGTRSHFDDRDTERFPSRSGVIGLLCAALGRPREAPLDDFAGLRMAARADLPGRLETDFQTAENVPTAAARGGTRPSVSHRHYLADAFFIVGLEGASEADALLLARTDAALRRPRWPLALGRKAFAPGLPVWLPGGLLPEATLQDAIAGCEWTPGRVQRRGPTPQSLNVEWERPLGRGVPRQDVPISFARGRREFRTRHVWHEPVPNPAAAGVRPDPVREEVGGESLS